MDSTEVELELEIDECPICAHDLDIHFTTECCRQKIHRKCFDDSITISNGRCPFCRTIHRTIIIVNNPFSVIDDLQVQVQEQEQEQYLREDRQESNYEMVHQTNNCVRVSMYFRFCMLFSVICMILAGLGVFHNKHGDYGNYYFNNGRYIVINMSDNKMYDNKMYDHNISVTNYTM